MTASACAQKICEPRSQDPGHKAPARPKSRRFRLAILLSQPVQYFAPLFRQLAQRPEIDLTVMYCSLGGAEAYFDPDFGRIVKWDTPLLEGYRYKVVRSWPQKNAQGFLASFAPAVLREIKAAKYDALIVFGWSNLTCWLAFAKARLESLPWMLYGDTNVIYEKEKHGIKRWLRTWLLGSLFRRTSAFLICSSMNQRFYELYRVPPGKHFDVPHAVDNEFFRNAARDARRHRDEVRARYGIPRNALLLLFAGKLIERKRPQDVLAAVENLRDDCPQLAAAFVGEGSLRKTLESQIAQRKLGNAILLGFGNQSEMPAIYAASDMLIVPSSVDPKPFVTNEAMACGLPVIVSNRTGVWGPEDLVRHGENGFVYPCGDVEALTETVRQLARDRELRERMGNRSREIIEQFSTERCAEGIVSALHFACSRSRSSN